MQEFIVSDKAQRIRFLDHLSFSLSEKTGRCGERVFSEGRAAVRFFLKQEEEREKLKREISDLLAVGYKYEYFQSKLAVCLGKKEKKYLLCAMIAADLEGDEAYIADKMTGDGKEFCVDGFFRFRMQPLVCKWDKIISYVPAAFSRKDLDAFISYLVSESRKKVYLKGNRVYDDNFCRQTRSRLVGEEDAETELLLADAGCIVCLGENEDALGEFLQKYYPQRLIFS